MSTIIQIKRSSGTTAPSELAQGELAYTYGTGTQGNLGDRLFIGTGTETDGVAANIDIIGGKYFTSLTDHVPGTLTASSALLVDSNKAIDELFVGNAAASGGAIKFNEGTNNGANYVALKAPNSVASNITLTLPGTYSNGQFLTVDGSGVLSFAAVPSGSFTISDGSTTDTFTTGQTLTFDGGTGIDTTVTDNQVSFAIDSTVATLSGTQTLTNKTINSANNTITITEADISDLGSYITASSTDTLTNKTFDANGTGNSISNIEVADLASGVLDTDLASVSASDDTLASAKAIKSYVDSQVTAQDLDFQADSGGALSIDLDSETLTFTGGTGIDTSGSGNTVTFAIDSTVATLTGSQTLTNKTLTSPVISTISNTGTLTLPTSTDTLVGRATTDTLTNKTINSASNTITITESNISDLGSYITASSTDTLTNKTINASQLVDGSVSNAKLANSSISFTDESSTAGSVSLGGTFEFLAGEGINTTASGATLTITGEDATTSNKGIASFSSDNFAVSSGAVTIKDGGVSNDELAGSIANAKLANSTISVTDGSTSTAVALGGTLTIQGTNNEIEVGESSGTFTVGLPNDITVGNNLTVTGNLTVNGTTTTLATTNSTVTDTLIELGNGTTGTPGNDSGIVIERGDADNAFIGFDESADKFIVGTGSFTGASTGNLTITTGTIVANLEATTATLGGSDVISTDNTKTLTNKTIDASSNTLSNIGNSSLTNSTITITGSDASSDAVALGETLTIANGEGIVTAIASNTLTITGENASTSNKGIASFSSDNFTVTSGAVAVTSIDGGTF